ncbi:MAG: preprotein translocase subunit SecE [Candidatus Eremiobacterota bacterium]
MGEFFTKNYNALIKYLKSVKSEIKRVTWPSKKELWTSTIMVTGTLVVVSIFVYFTDQIFVIVFNAIHNNVR